LTAPLISIFCSALEQFIAIRSSHHDMALATAALQSPHSPSHTVMVQFSLPDTLPPTPFVATRLPSSLPWTLLSSIVE